MTVEDPEMGGGGGTGTGGPSMVAGAEADVIDGGGDGADDSSSSIPNDAVTTSESTYDNPTTAQVASARRKKMMVGGAVVAVICLTAIAIGVAVPISRNRREAAAAASAAAQQQQDQQAQKDDEKGTDTGGNPPDDATKTDANDTDGGGGGGIDPDTGVITGPGLDPPSINVANRFNVKVPSFSPYVMQPYDACDDLTDDVELALKLLADQVIERNKDMECYGHFYDGPMWAETAMGGAQPEMMATTAVMDTTSAAKNDVPASAPPPDTAGDAANDESYGTNNQVEGVDEADVVKSDGTYIFAAYGSDLVMMDLDGKVVDRLTVPDPPEDETDEARAQDEDAEDAISGSFVGGMDVIGIYPPVRYKPQRTIKSLLLDSDRGVITAIAHYEHSWNYRERNIVSGGVTTAYVFNYATEELISLGEVDLPGRYASARSIESNAHVVTGSYIDTSGFTRELDRCSVEYDDMDSTEYEMAAFQTARATVSEFARELVEELRWAGDSSCDHIVRISSYEEPAAATEADDDEVSASTLRRLDLTDGRGILNGFVQISSFDTSLDGVGKLSSGEGVSVAGAFVPTSSAPTSETYASEDFIVLAGRGYRQDPSDGSWSQHTFLMSFALDGPKAVQSAVGEAPGYLLNQFGMDYHDGVFRIATTNRARWGVTVDERTGDRRWEVQSVSSSQVTKFEFENGAMREVGRLDGLGKTEQITSCRFVRDRAYVVTFQLKDPLYVIDMVPDTPEVLGELNVTGFSSYIHPIGENQELLLTVGQEADPKTGWATGMKVSLFDVSDPTDPTEIQKYVATEDGGGSSSSAAQWDHHAFRYLDASSKLILPLWRYRYRSEDNFDGFVVYDVDPDAPLGEGIRPLGNVTHADHDEINNVRGSWCFGRASLPPRSMVFSGGDLVTFKGHSIMMSRGYLSNLEGNGGGVLQEEGAGDGGWTKNLDEGRVEGEDVCYDYFFW